MDKSKKVYVAGHAGLVGSAICRKLRENGFNRIVTRTRGELELLDQAAVARFFQEEHPDIVFMAAGKTGGVHALNTYRADFLHENIVVQSNIIHQAFLTNVEKLMFLACFSIHPQHSALSISEGTNPVTPLEDTYEAFAIAKIAGIKMCESYNRQYGTDFISVVPDNIYGPNQSYVPINAPVIPSLLMRFLEAKINNYPSVVVWGSGAPKRSFLYVDDLADVCLFLMDRYSRSTPVNIGTGTHHSIAELAQVIREVVGFSGEIHYDPSFPEGTMQKSQDLSILQKFDWKPKVDLKEGIRRTYQSLVCCQPTLKRTPILRIPVSEKDTLHLNRIVTDGGTPSAKKNQPKDYFDKVVLKPWGYEYLIFENGLVAIWFLHIHGGHATSMHCHPNKLSSLILLSGEAMCSTFRKRHMVVRGQSLVFDPKVFHSTKAISSGGIDLVEIEYPVNKTDLVRLEDAYGRTKMGYESISQMVHQRLETYGYFSFKEKDCDGKYHKKEGQWSISLEHYPDMEAFTNRFVLDPNTIYASLRGTILGNNGLAVLELGATQVGAWLETFSPLSLEGETTLMKFTNMASFCLDSGT